MIEVKDVRKYYGRGESRFEVLKGISLSIQDGDFTVILGASGSGKSTLLNVISGLEPVDAGTVCYDETDITSLSDRELTEFRKKTVGFVFQQYYLLTDMNVDQNVKMGADLAGSPGNHGWRREKRLQEKRAYREVIRAVGLGDKLYRYPGELSGGEQQRVSVARALAKKPRVLFLDEPTGALDEETGRQILDYISRLQEIYHFTIVMVTHNQNISQMAKTVIEMNSGRISGVRTNDQQKNAYEIGW